MNRHAAIHELAQTYNTVCHDRCCSDTERETAWMELGAVLTALGVPPEEYEPILALYQ